MKSFETEQKQKTFINHQNSTGSNKFAENLPQSVTAVK